MSASSGRGKGGKGLGKLGSSKTLPARGLKGIASGRKPNNASVTLGMVIHSVTPDVTRVKTEGRPDIRAAISAADTVRRQSRRNRQLEPENEGLTRPERSSGGGLLSGRAKASTSASMDTSQENAARMAPLLANNAFKEGTYRVHVKGTRSTSGTSGIRPYFTDSGTRSWSDEHEKVRNALGKHLMEQKSFTPLNSGTASWGAENSHFARKAMHGPDDVLNAPPASVHQNTEMLGIETGVEHLEKALGDRLRVKFTGYVHDEKQGHLAGTLKAFRYKIHMRDDQGGWNKVFDHIGSGLRGNIDQDEARGLREEVKALTPDSKALPSRKAGSGGFLPGKGVHGAAPTESAIRKGAGSSALSPMVTDMRHGSTVYNRQQALSTMEAIIKKRAKQIAGK